MIEPSFVDRIENQLRHLYETIYTGSEALCIVLQYPKLFPEAIQKLALRVYAPGQQTATQCIFEHFQIRQTLELSVAPLAFVIHRDRIAEDGELLVRTFFAHRIPVEIVFAGEGERGPQSPKEFFAAFSRTLWETQHRLFRYANDHEQYCKDDSGLFLHPMADAQNCFTIGVLCAKAIALDCQLDVPFNPAFFALIRGEMVDIRDIDPILGNGIADFDGCLAHPFSYPGIPELSLEPGSGEREVIDMQSHQDFVRLIQEFTCGKEHFSPHVAEFLRGFNRVMPWSSLDAFSAEDICRMVSRVYLFTREWMESHFVFENGYDFHSVQIQWLMEILSEMPFQDQQRALHFVTGLDSGPTTRLGSLNPSFTIAKADCSAAASDKEMPLPSVPVTNWLRLPEYPTKELLSRKLLTAITDGRE
jgi:hypothetical protein